MAFGLTQQAQLVHEDQDNADGRNETENKDIQRIISGTECPVVGHFTPDNAAGEYPSHKELLHSPSARDEATPISRQPHVMIHAARPRVK